MSALASLGLLDRSPHGGAVGVRSVPLIAILLLCPGSRFVVGGFCFLHVSAFTIGGVDSGLGKLGLLDRSPHGGAVGVRSVPLVAVLLLCPGSRFVIGGVCLLHVSAFTFGGVNTGLGMYFSPMSRFAFAAFLCLHISAFAFIGARGGGSGVNSGLGEDGLIWESAVVKVDSLNGDGGECGEERGEAHFKRCFYYYYYN